MQHLFFQKSNHVKQSLTMIVVNFLATLALCHSVYNMTYDFVNGSDKMQVQEEGEALLKENFKKLNELIMSADDLPDGDEFEKLRASLRKGEAQATMAKKLIETGEQLKRYTSPINYNILDASIGHKKPISNFSGVICGIILIRRSGYWKRVSS